ncbi:MAG TPA: Gfo/Idh/MocA family oxidoreductase [Thermomicrobiales bacterium]|nr:Gfo/Idh/MocA family oxidoreductase [Thermomicrobiales bacterium]
MTTLAKIGISGAGVIGQLHASALAGIDEASLVAIAEPREDAGRELAGKYGVDWYPSLEAMLASADIDTVIVATPSGLHPDQVIAAARAGKNVITEKPMAITAEGATAMIDACDEAGVRFAVIFQNRMSTDVMKVKRAIEWGLLGIPILANGTMYWYRSDEYYAANGGWRGTWALDGGGALMNQAIHTVDMLQWMMGGVASIQAHTATLGHDIETEDVASASFRFNNGALGSITATTCAAKDYPVRIEIIGTKGRVTLENNAITLQECESELSDDLLTPEDHELADGWADGEDFGLAHRRQLRAILHHFADGTPAEVPGNEARKAVDIILGIYESNRSGTRIMEDSQA